MTKKISMDYFKNKKEHYHVYKINCSAVAEEFHFHDFYQICYIIKGNIQHGQEGRIVYLETGDAFIIPPGYIHNIHFPEPNSEIYSLSFQEDLFHSGFSHSNVYNFLSALKLNTIGEKRIDVRLKVEINDSQKIILNSLFDCLIREFSSDYPKELTAAASLISSILCVLSQSYFMHPKKKKNTLDDIIRYSENIKQCISYIDRNFMLPLTVEKLAYRFALSRTNLSVLFPNIAGTSLKRYINKKRIEQAAALSRIETMPFNEISQLVGYDDFSTFYRNFTKTMGMSPAHYRSICKNSIEDSSSDPI